MSGTHNSTDDLDFIKCKRKSCTEHSPDKIEAIANKLELNKVESLGLIDKFENKYFSVDKYGLLKNYDDSFDDIPTNVEEITRIEYKKKREKVRA